MKKALASGKLQGTKKETKETELKLPNGKNSVDYRKGK